MPNDRNLSKKLLLFPLNSEKGDYEHLYIGGCDTVELAKEYGTPLYIFDEITIRRKCQEFQSEFTKLYPDTLVIYASKAFLILAIAHILKEEGLGLDVVSGGELSIAQAAYFPLDKTYFHGNNKTPDELRLALNSRIGRIVIDNLYELDLIDQLAGRADIKQDILLRINPGVDPHTHRHTTTGTLDSKFGFPIVTGQAAAAVSRVMLGHNINLIGLHFHLGSPITDVAPYQTAIDIVLRFAKEIKRKYDFNLKEFSPGGGFAVRYTKDSLVPSIADYAEAITTKLTSMADELNLPHPKCIIEPGRAIIGQAGVAVYTVGAIKEIPGIRKYVAVDGGLGDNIRPALYGAKYEALVANKLGEKELDKVTIAGRYCESGDIIAKNAVIAPPAVGDIIAIPVSGAYCIPMSNNYNSVPRPGVIMVKDGKARLIRKRESYQDLMRLDVV